MYLEEFKELLKHHDWYYFMSDDPRVYHRGEEESARIKQIAKTSDEHRKAYDEERAKYTCTG